MIRVVGIVGTSFCGSTALGMALGSCPGTAFIGESNAGIAPFSPPRCPRPEKMRSRHIALHGRDTAWAYKYLCERCGDACRVWRVDEMPYPTDKAHNLLAARTGADILIDSAKLPHHFRAYENATGGSVDFCYVVLVKSPERQLASFMRNLDTPDLIDGHAWGYIELYGKIADFLRDRKGMVLDYEDFAVNPTTALARIGQIAGLDPGERKPTNDHMIGCNRRAIDSYTGIRLDQSWQAFRLDPELLARMRPTYERVRQELA